MKNLEAPIMILDCFDEAKDYSYFSIKLWNSPDLSSIHLFYGVRTKMASLFDDFYLICFLSSYIIQILTEVRDD